MSRNPVIPFVGPGMTTVSSAEVDAPLFTVSVLDGPAVSVSMGMTLSSVVEISICEGDAGLPSMLTVDSLLATRITKGCSFLHMSTSF